MKIIGYLVHGKQPYIAFIDDSTKDGSFKITEGFHDRVVAERNKAKFSDYKQVNRTEVDIGKIYRRLRGTRPWHPLVKVLSRTGVKG